MRTCVCMDVYVYTCLYVLYEYHNLESFCVGNFYNKVFHVNLFLNVLELFQIFSKKFIISGNCKG